MFKVCRSVASVVALFGVVASTAAQPATQPSTRRGRPPTSYPATNPADVARLAALGKRDARTHDPSTIVRRGDAYYFFCTGRGVESYRSTDLKTWTPGPRVFDRPLAWFGEVAPGNRGHLWAPDVVRVDDARGERWLLYYSVSSFGRNTSAIALATNRTLDPSDANYMWNDDGVVIQTRQGDDFNAIDPAVFRDPKDGRLWMSLGSFWSGIRLIELNPATGLRKANDLDPRRLAWTREIEAPFIHPRPDGKYYLFVSWGICCRGVNSTYEIRVGRSDRVEGPYLDRDGVDLAKGGGTPVMKSDGPFVGPGHPSIVADADGRDWLSGHFYDATRNGEPHLFLRPLTWDADGWPAVTTSPNP